MAKKKHSYRVIADTSVRGHPDKKHPDYETWIDFPAGTVVTDPPEHADVKGWVESGHWVAEP